MKLQIVGFIIILYVDSVILILMLEFYFLS